MDIPENSLEELEVLNLSDNKLTAFPMGISRCQNLQRFYANFNEIIFEGLHGCRSILSVLNLGMPPSIGKLMQLQVLYLSHNKVDIQMLSAFN